jgi:hypothetical protein
VEIVMVRNSTVIALKNNPRRYNVIYGRKELNRDVGAGTIVKRAFHQAGLNKYVPRTANAIGEISDFLKYNKEKKEVDFDIKSINPKNNIHKINYDFKKLVIEGDPTQYKLYANKEDYYLWIPVEGFGNNRCLHIKAQSDDDFKSKLEKLFNNSATRAKLDFIVSNFPVGLPNILRPGMPRHEIFLDEERLTGAYQQNTYRAIGIDGDLEQFDSKLGSIDRKQMSFFAPLTSFEGYSGREEKPLIVRDDTWMKSHEANQFVNASNDCRELLETIIAQTYSGQKLDPKFSAEMCVRLREDFIHNIYGFHTLNTHTKGQTLLPYQDTPKRWELHNDPLRGGRFWEDHAPSSQEIAMLVYAPQIDGSAKLRCATDNDADKETFRSLIDILKIKPKDRQYMMNYARKALGIKIAMKFMQEELAKIKLDDPVLSEEEKTKQQKIWQELAYVKDQLFNNSGDLRDSLRKRNIGFSAYAEGVGLFQIPKLKQSNYYNINVMPDKEKFIKDATEGLGQIAENYPYFQNIYGVHGVTYMGNALQKNCIEKIFNRKVPKSVAEQGAIMLLETISGTGTRLKLFNEVYDKDASLGGLTKKLYTRVSRGDFSNAGDIVKRQKKRVKQLFQGKQDRSDTGVKRLALQGEGVMFEEEVFGNYTGSYAGDNNGLVSSSHLSDHDALRGFEDFMCHFSWKEYDKVVGQILPTMVDFARFMRTQQARLIHDNQQELLSASPTKRKEILKKVYQSPEMLTLDTYIKAAAHKMALGYFEKNKHTLNDGADEDLRILFKQVKIEYINLLQMTANVTAMIAYNAENRPLK